MANPLHNFAIPPTTPPLPFDCEMIARHSWVMPRQIIPGWEVSSDGQGSSFFTAYFPYWQRLGVIDDHFWNRPLGPYPYEDSVDAYYAIRGESRINMMTGCVDNSFSDPLTDELNRPPPYPCVDPQRQYSGDDAYLENSLSFVDSMDEWYYDRALDRLTVFLPAAENPNVDNPMVPILDRLIAGTGVAANGGQPDKFLQYFRFTALNFAYTNYTWPTPTYQPPGISGPGYRTGQAGHATDYYDTPPGAGYPRTLEGGKFLLTGALFFDNIRYCRIEKCRIAHTGASAIQMYGHDCEIRHNDIFDIGGTGIYVADGLLAHTVTGHKGIVHNNVIEFNRVQGFGVTYYDAVGIFVGLSRGLVLCNNEVANGGYTGISIGWNWSRLPISNSAIVAQNKVHDVMKVLEDGAGIYLLGNHGDVNLPNSHSNLIGNYVFDIGRDPTLPTDREGPTVGIYWDQGSANWHVWDNVIEDCEHPVYLQIGSELCPGPFMGNPNIGIPNTTADLTTFAWPGFNYLDLSHRIECIIETCGEPNPPSNVCQSQCVGQCRQRLGAPAGTYGHDNYANQFRFGGGNICYFQPGGGVNDPIAIKQAAGIPLPLPFPFSGCSPLIHPTCPFVPPPCP